MSSEMVLKKICVVGLGYVGLPLACAFAKSNYEVVGYDVSEARIAGLNRGDDRTGEITKTLLNELSSKLTFSSNSNVIGNSDIIIVAVPTPIKVDNTPNLEPLISATKILAANLKHGSTVVYESTVFPGATEEICVPLIEAETGFRLNTDFYVGYSPERINPGDKVNRLENIIKIVSGSNIKTLRLLEQIYGDIVDAGIHSAPSIKVAEAAKITENIQRDVNIALVNELHQIFSLMNINTMEVIAAASTKWNFMRVEPGLVGGHCIGVDPHYMIYKSTGHGHIPNLMRNAREINEGMSTWVVNNFLQFCQINRINLLDKTVTIMGYTFKKNCPDTRNTKVDSILKSLERLGIETYVWDPYLDVSDRERLLANGVEINEFPPKNIDVGMVCVKHDIILDYLKSFSGNVFDFTNLRESGA
ncbi:MAG: nucleotide sugar dehydrogenase [Bacteroidetes bacterium]|nr:nucleotide sugar dehydrogenase [Bacteroidota bacterium]